MNLSSTDTLFYLVSNLFRIYVILKFIEVFFKEQVSHFKYKFFVFISFYISNSFLYLIFSNPFVNLFSNLFFAFIYTLLFNSKLWLKVGCIFLVYSIGMLLDQLTYDFLLSLKIDNHIFTVTIIISNIFLYMFILIINRILDKKKIFTLTLLQWVVIFTIPLGTIFILLILFLLDYHYYSTLLISSILLFMNIIVFYFYDIILKFYEDKQEKELLARQNIAYSNQFEIIKTADSNLRTLRHDFKNHLLVLQKFLNENQIDLVKKYLNEIYKFTEVKSQYVTSLNQPVNSILNYKLQDAANIGAQITCHVEIPDQLEISAFDLNVILGNLLDNAIEAFEETSNKILTIAIQLEKNLLYIDISNTYSGTIYHTNSKILSRKKDSAHHGIGLESVKSVVNKYDGEMEISYDNSIFIVNIVLCNSKI